MITKEIAKKDSILILSTLQSNPFISNKMDLSDPILSIVLKYRFHCPLCDYFYELHPFLSCKGCPLKNCFEDSDYFKWKNATSDKQREDAAASMLNKVIKW
jgi:hypothetical protein